MPEQPPRPLHFAAFVMNTTSHIQHGHVAPTRRARQADFNDARRTGSTWRKTARARAGSTRIFFADVVGLYGPTTAATSRNVRRGAADPEQRPLGAAVGARRATPSHLGLAFTSSVLQEHPFNFARRMSTLDHISKGRIAWNIVTSTQENAARNFGLDGPDRARRALRLGRGVRRRHLQAVGGLVGRRRPASRTGSAACTPTPAKIHKINHVGHALPGRGPAPAVAVAAADAGAVPGRCLARRARAFAARNAEAVFIVAPTPSWRASGIERHPRRVAVARSPGATTSSSSRACTFVVGSTEEEARARTPSSTSTSSSTATSPTCTAAVGIDSATTTSTRPIGELAHRGRRSIVELDQGPASRTGPRPCATWPTPAAANRRVVGTPEQIADRLEDWQAAGVDGINVVNADASPAATRSSSTTSCPCCRTAAWRSGSTPRARCARSSSARETVSPTATRRPATAAPSRRSRPGAPCDGREETADPESVRDELRQPHHPRAVAAAGQQPGAVQRHRVLDRAGAAARRGRLRRGVPGRRGRHLRHVPRLGRHGDPAGTADPEQRPGRGGAGDGGGVEAPRFRHHVLHDVRAAVRVGPPCCRRSTT